MLALIGLGLFDEKDITLRGMEFAKNADRVYIETYTSMWGGKVAELEKMIGKSITTLDRSDLEERSSRILDEAKERTVAVFVGGDPMVATTHSAILVEARKLGIDTTIIHNSSIISAITETGLHAYKFGATVTIPSAKKTGGILPKSVYDSIVNNKKLGLHTLCLLDTTDGAVSVTQALDVLLELGKKHGATVLNENTPIVVYSFRYQAETIFGKIRDIRGKTFGQNPHVVVICGNLHYSEEEFLVPFEKNRKP